MGLPLSRAASASASVIAVALAAVYVVRAGAGLQADRAYRRGSIAEEGGRFHDAAADLARAAVGGGRDTAFWLGGWARLGQWDAASGGERTSGAADEHLEGATASFLSGLAESPASGWYLSGLAEIYARRERLARRTRSFDLAELAKGPWALVGDDGRVAIGFARLAIGREPNTAPFRDRLALLLWSFGLKDASLAAIRESARVLPEFRAHTNDLSFESLPRELSEAFYRASRENVGVAPLQFKERHLVSLGILARQLGRLTDSEADLRAALEAPGTRLYHAEDAYHLGLTLLELGREEEADAQFHQAEAFDVFLVSILTARAAHAEARGRLDQALDALGRLRALEPRDVDACLRFADVATRLDLPDRAEEALRFASVVAPEDFRPRRALALFYFRTGRRSKAAALLDELRARGDGGAEFQALEHALQGSAP